MKIFRTLSFILLPMILLGGCSKNEYKGTDVKEVSGKKL